MSKRPTSMVIVRQQLQHLLTQQMAKQLSPLQQSLPPVIKRRGFVGCLAMALVGLATVGSSTAITGYVLQHLAATTHLPPPDTSGQPATVTPTADVANSLSLTVPLYTYRGHQGTVTALSWSPNGHWIASAGAIDQTVQVWDAVTGEPLIINTLASDDTVNTGPRRPRSRPAPAVFPMAQQRVDALAWAPDSVRLAAALGNDSVQLRTMPTGSIFLTTFAQPGDANTLAWSPDASRIASLSGNSSVRVWSATTGDSLFTYNDHAQAVFTLSWSPDGEWIASGGADNTVQVWDATTESRLFVYRGHSATVNAVAWSPDGKRIASGSADATVQVWQAVHAS